MSDDSMRIGGFQKLTLLDYPGKVACTAFLGGCNLRCPFCHNGALVLEPGPPILTGEELLAFLARRRGLLDGVCITGGEPLLHPDLPRLLEAVKGLGFCLKLDTNGGFPRALEDVIARWLVDYVAMDIKNSLARYPETAGVPGLDTAPYRESAALLLEEKDCTARSMYDAVRALLDDPKRLAAMHEAALGLAIFDSAQRIYDNIMTLIR